MRKIPFFKSEGCIKTIILAMVVIALILLFSRNSHVLMKFLVGQEINLKTAQFNESRTEHFTIKYLPQDQESLHMIAAAAEQAYMDVTEFLGTKPETTTTVVVYPDSQSLAQSFGWEKDARAVGVYWAGSIRILSPLEWINTDKPEEIFSTEGPMYHEFVHLMVDEITRGNYTRWWTEGIAQYVEKQLTGFEFPDPVAGGAGTEIRFYSLDDLNRNFDNLDESIAYWESLRLVEYIAENYGQDTLFEIMEYLGRGASMEKAIEKSLGVKLKVFEENAYGKLTDYYKGERV